MKCGLLSVISCLLVVECLASPERFRRQAPPSEEDDECRPPHISGHGPPMPPPECCKMFDITEGFKGSVAACDHLKPSHSPMHQENQHFSGPPRGSPPDDIGCYIECLFNQSGLLTEDMKINKEKLINDGNMTSAANLAWKEVITKGLDVCFEESVYEGTDKHECKSGAIEFKTCISHYMFMNCPGDNWTTSKECTELKQKAKKCHKMHIPGFMDFKDKLMDLP